MLLGFAPSRAFTTAVVCAMALNLVAISALASPAGDPPPVGARQPAPVAPTKPWGQLKSDSGQTWLLTKPEITIGSDATSDVVLADATVAPHQCRMSFASGNALIEDLGSKSATLVAGTALKPGKVFAITNAVEIDPGAVTLHFQFLERGVIGPSATVKPRKPVPKLKVQLPKTK